MLKEYLEIGKIVGTHGVMGECRVECWCDSPQFLSKFTTLYFDKGAEKLSVKGRPHKNIALLKIEGVTTVEQADLLRGKVLYVRRKDVKLPRGVHFVQDLIGLQVKDFDTDAVYGTITDVLKTGVPGGTSRTWALLSHEKDETFLRNEIALDLAREPLSILIPC